MLVELCPILCPHIEGYGRASLPWLSHLPSSWTFLAPRVLVDAIGPYYTGVCGSGVPVEAGLAPSLIPFLVSVHCGGLPGLALTVRA